MGMRGMGRRHGTALRTLGSLASLTLLASCRPDFPERESLITEPRVVAIVSTPAEAKVGEAVHYQAWVARSVNDLQPSRAEWALCATPRRLTENGSVSPDCLGEGVVPLTGADQEVSVAIPPTACSLFGPETPPGDFRPRDPDGTGGFYQPVRLKTDGVVAFGMTRIGCNLANAPVDAVREFSRTYRANVNPVLQLVRGSMNGAAFPALLTEAPTTVPPSARVTFRAEWPEASRESYAFYDPNGAKVVLRVETMRVSWFATAGSFAVDRTGRSPDEGEPWSENMWNADGASGTVLFWVVLRDDRGGTAVRTFTLFVSS